MYLKYILIPLALLLFACSDDMGTGNGSDMPSSGDMQYNYLSVTIVPTESGATRADDDFSVGSQTENKVNSIRFYFFGQDMKAVPVKVNGATHYDVTAASGEISNDYDSENADNSNNIESTISAVIVLESQKGDDFINPYYMVAVVNPTASTPILAKGDDIGKLQAAADYGNYYNGFVMSSTAYKDKKKNYDPQTKQTSTDADDSEIIAQLVYDKIKNSRLEALENPATIFVERILAKVTAHLDIVTIDGAAVTSDNKKTITSDGESFDIYKLTSSKVDVKDSGSDGDIWVRFLGWNVTATRNTSRLVKKINTLWTNRFDGWTLDWNDNRNFRSYWAINPASTSIESDYAFFDFNAARAVSFTENNYAYLQENAGKESDGLSADAMNSKIIVAAQLVDANGVPLDLIRWGAQIYNTGRSVRNAIAEATKIYVNKNGVWQSLSADDIELKGEGVANADDAFKENASPRYYAYVTIKATDENGNPVKYALYKSGSGDDTELDKGASDEGYSANDEIIQTALRSVGIIFCWHSGYTYYWIDIRHFGGDIVNTDENTKEENPTKDGPGKYGVVRNHWYDVTFTSVAGLGVPVSNPNEKIYPEIPANPEDFYMAAEIRILSWRMVYQGDITLTK